MAKCRACGSQEVVKLSSINMVHCNICRRYTVWNLKAGEPSVLIHNFKGEECTGSETNTKEQSKE